jgi:hypothetical protein
MSETEELKIKITTLLEATCQILTLQTATNM